jgi:hypothetical protein
MLGEHRGIAGIAAVIPPVSRLISGAAGVSR